MVDPTLLAQLAKCLGSKAFTDDASEMAPWLSDWRGRVHGRAAAMLSPATTAEVQAIVRLCADARQPLTLQGGNSGQCAGATPDASGDMLLLSLRRMNRIRRLDADAQLLFADAGVILAHAHDAAAAQGLRFALTLGGKGSATLGGLVATNAGGTQVLRHGNMRALTRGLEVVLADGRLLDVMTPLAKDNQGPDSKQIFIGGEGAFGIVTGVTLQLCAAVHEHGVGWMSLATPDAALTALRRMQSQLGQMLEGFEILPEAALTHVLAHIPGTRRPVATAGPWHILVEAVGDGAGDALEAALASCMADGLASDATIAASQAQAADFWRIRDSISEAERAIGPAMQHDISVPVDAMPDFLQQVPAELASRFSAATCLAFGHLGDGNVHFHVRPPLGCDANGWIAAHGGDVARAVYAAAIARGGSLSAEHGIGRTKRAIFGEYGDPARIAILRGLKAALDPDGLLNPGVLIPD